MTTNVTSTGVEMRQWLQPISADRGDSRRVHLVPEDTDGTGLVFAACGKMVALQFAKPNPTAKRCQRCGQEGR